MHIIYKNLPLFISPNLYKTFQIEGEEFYHAIKVLRIKKGDFIKITNGTGNMVIARITEIGKNSFYFEITEEIETKPLSYKLHLAVAPTKNIDRYDFMVEKCTEIGFSELTPIICEQSERKTVKIDRLQRIVNAAVKQSLKAQIPIINEPENFEKFVKKYALFQNKYLSLCTEIEKTAIMEIVNNVKDAIVTVGPEGDFSEREINFALQNGFKPVSLGTSRLRTETAGITVCNAFYLMNN